MRKRVWDIVNRARYPYTACIIDNQLVGFNSEFPESNNVRLLSVTDGEGRRTYERTIAFLSDYLLSRAGYKNSMKMEHSLGEALYGEAVGLDSTNAVEIIERGLHELSNTGVPIETVDFTKQEAIRYLREEKRYHQERLVEYMAKDIFTFYRIANYMAYMAGPLVPDTSFIQIFDVKPYNHGFLIFLPDVKDPHQLAKPVKRDKLFETFQESKTWAEILEIEDVGHLNEAIESGRISDLIKIQEGFHEKKTAQIADSITRRSTVKIVLIAGPSSSGKTTFSKRLKTQLIVNGLTPKTISVDDYFVNREKTPVNKDGMPDYESFYAIDYMLFRDHIRKLIEGEKVLIPKFDFIKGKRDGIREEMQLTGKDIIIVEGIHALNPELTVGIEEKHKYKVYVSCLTQLNIDRLNRIPTRDTRIIRRMVRDFRYRGHSASDTILMWPRVAAGEDIYIFPYQEEADVMFNSALTYELAILKNYAEPLLRSAKCDEESYSEALRLLNFLFHFIGVMPFEIPPTSILREFIGGSSFEY
ncbi:MAG TPA: nucleoside kinase [Candidatus Hydrothermia bacterium]|nr:nucleoside kinase [Candidatus Hydrothermae bacterium]MDD3649251.1 nucleoside kinase [Candidatus Hydrothermia bacterium]MDD5573084.1 nucleoside kinase [Candidatus Hydrothermia bacterium]HOK22665.1 nucleoside kinase [Candidatus Hydrothermia bacterium]HOL23374.1 nucleoside kinase [Candidatus Hydrothermia bacterium]